MYRLSSLIKDITPEVVVKEDEVTGMKSFSLLEDEILEDQESNRIFTVHSFKFSFLFRRRFLL